VVRDSIILSRYQKTYMLKNDNLNISHLSRKISLCNCIHIYFSLPNKKNISWYSKSV